MAEKTTGFMRRHKGTHIFQQLMIAGQLVAVGIISAIAAGAANVCEVTLSVVDADGNAITGSFAIDIWLSDAATGLGLTGTSASGTVTAKTGTGTVLGDLTAKKAIRAVTKADGTFVLEITDTAKTGFYVAASVPTLNVAEVSRVLVSGDYGA